MSEALLALGGSLLAAGMAIWLVLQSRAQGRQSLRSAARHRETLSRQAADAAQRSSTLQDRMNMTYIMQGNGRLNGLTPPTGSFDIHRAD
ncbi:hypothetical protein [Sphingomonas sp.]|uniref:hypothetical protein n=1 Tax=Sphingomonas sp. TaxID=28214 RepID=UPI0035BC70AB